MQDTIFILDFGSQYTQLIARRIRELNVYCEIHPYNHFPEITPDVKGIILSGSPASVRDADAPWLDVNFLIESKPVLGICYGAQLIAQVNRGDVQPSSTREYGRANLSAFAHDNPLLHEMSTGTQVWMSHGDTILSIPDSFKVIASTNDVKIAAFQVNDSTFGIQFHPEVYHTPQGSILLRNFVVNICGCRQTWTPESFVESSVASLKAQLGNDKVVLGLSGGVDSSVAALLLHRAVGENLYCIFVDNGLLRKNEFDLVLNSYKLLGLNVKGVRAADQFYLALKNLTDPEEKRKAIGRTFIEVFDNEAHLIKEVSWLAQGTIYPDVIESVSVKGPSATIKSHHNVGGLPDFMKLRIVEPLKALFKDEVRKVGASLHLPSDILNRHPFPGPGLAIRILGEVNEQNIRILQDVDDIFINGLKEYNLYHEVWQAAAILLPVRSVGVMGDERTYENVIALRAVNSTDGMTADWSWLPYEFLARMSSEIINKVKGVNRVVYDISSKPPATIEWE